MICNCTLIRDANRKGYSGVEICKLVNQAGLKCHINTFRTAVRDGISRTKGQEAIYTLASSILQDLPTRIPATDDFTARAKQAGFTVKEVWERYQASHEKQYDYMTFMVALRRKTSPFEITVANEAAKCLADMMAEQNG